MERGRERLAIEQAVVVGDELKAAHDALDLPCCRVLVLRHALVQYLLHLGKTALAQKNHARIFLLSLFVTSCFLLRWRAFDMLMLSRFSSFAASDGI